MWNAGGGAAVAEPPKFTSKEKTRMIDAARKRKSRGMGSDIGRIPPIINKSRRDLCEFDLERFCKEYLPESFPVDFCDDHRKLINKIQIAILTGGRFCEAVFRGFGKSTIAEAAVLWAAIYGHRKYLVLIGSDADAAKKNIESIKTEIEENDRILEDFPEVAFPVRALEGKVQRCASQSSMGRLTHIEWNGDTVVFPTVEGAKTSGTIIATRGITGRIRGLKIKSRDKKQLRPDFCLIDDPQTDESAASPAQVRKRLDILTKAILKLAGHSRRLAVVVAATVIQKDDFVDTLLDPKQSPAWVGERIPMVKKWADAHDSLWLTDYAALRAQDIQADPPTEHATKFYKKNRKKMDKGAVVAWDGCFDETEISAIQHAYNALIDDGPAVFASEYQNEPLDDTEGGPVMRLKDMAQKTNGLRRRQAPEECQTVTAFVDVGGETLHYCVCAFSQDDFTGAILDYGVQKVKKAKGGLSASLTTALNELTEKIIETEYTTEGGTEIDVQRILVDSGWQAETVYQWTRRNKYKALTYPSKGWAAKQFKQMISKKRQKGERFGKDWKFGPTREGGKLVPLMQYSADAWKSATHERFSTSEGGAGSLSLWEKTRGTSGLRKHDHRPFCEHCTAEKRERITTDKGDEFEIWRLIPGRDNHWFDCLIGCHVAASFLGVKAIGEVRKTARRKKRKRKIYSGD